MQIDLSSAYDGTVHRTITLDKQADRAVIADVFAFDRPSEVWWFAHSRAKIELAEDGRSALLKRGGKRMRVHINAPADARLTVMPAEPLPDSPNPPGQRDNKGVQKLAIRLQAVRDARLEVVVTPVD